MIFVGVYSFFSIAAFAVIGLLFRVQITLHCHLFFCPFIYLSNTGWHGMSCEFVPCVVYRCSAAVSQFAMFTSYKSGCWADFLVG